MARISPVNLTPDELAALDLLILSAIRRGKGLIEPMSFIDVIVNAVENAANDVANDIQDIANQAADAGQDLAHVMTEVAQEAEAQDLAQAMLEAAQATEMVDVGAGGDVRQRELAEAFSNMIATTAKLRPVTLELLIELRRGAIGGGRPKGRSRRQRHK